MYYGFKFRKTEGFRKKIVWFNEFQSVQDAQSYCEYATKWFENYNLDFQESDRVIFSYDPFTVYFDIWTNQHIELRIRLLDCWQSWLGKNDRELSIYGVFIHGSQWKS